MNSSLAVARPALRQVLSPVQDAVLGWEQRRGVGCSHTRMALKALDAALGTLAVVTLLMTSSAAGARVRPAKDTNCPSGKHALVADAQAEVYETGGGAEREIFACAYAGGRTYALGPKPEGTPEGGGGVAPDTVTLTGAVVAYEKFGVRTEGPSYWRVIVRNLRSGRVLHRLPSMGGFVWSLVVKSDGSVAWIVNTRGQPLEYSVVSAGKTGIRTLASGLDVAPSSLALAGSTLYWTQDGKPFSAVLR
jgi:hypothetical protein